MTGIVVNYKTQVPKTVLKEIRKNMYYIQKYGFGITFELYRNGT